MKGEIIISIIQEVKYNQYLREFFNSLPSGVFLTAKSGELLNTMTIGWGCTGIMWGKPILMVMVRSSRYTYQLIEKSSNFTVSIPFHDRMAKELDFCGSMSGRDHNKFNECKLSAIPGKTVDTPVIGGCDLFYECKICYKQPMDESKLITDFKKKWYPEQDYHTLYYGEILSCYIRKG